MNAARGALFLLAAGLLPACSALEAELPKSERRYRAELARVTDLKDLVPLILRTPDQDFLYEQSLLRMIEIGCGPAARKEVDDFLDLCEARLRQMLKEQPPKSAERVFLALKGLWLDLDLKYVGAPLPGEGKQKMLEDLSFLRLARRREGRCGSFTQMFLCLGERLGLPLFHVAMPKHAFIRIEMKGQTLNFETTNPVWSRERKNDFYIDHYGADSVHPAGSTFLLRSLTRREAALDAIGDEISGVWLAERRYDDVLELMGLLEERLGPDVLLMKRMSTLFFKSYDEERKEVLDEQGVRMAFACAERLFQIAPAESTAPVVLLGGYSTILKDPVRARVVAERIRDNPRASAEAKRMAQRYLLETPK